MKNKRGKIVLVVILAVIAILMLFTYVTKKVENRTANLDSELLRSKNYAQVTDEQSKVENTDFVKFSAFFTRDINGDGNAEKLLGTCKRAIGTDQLYMDLNVLTNGYLKNGKITINGTNFKYSMSMVKDSVLKNNYISDDVKVIELNNVNAGTQKLIIGNIIADIENNVNNYSSVSSVTLTGTHVSDDGVETEISKTVDLTVDWYGLAKTELYTKYQATTFYYNYNELDSTTISFNFRLDEIQQELILKENEAVLTIPELNGYAPTEVKCTNSNIESEYNNETKKLTIKRSSKLNNNGIIVSELSNSNSYNVNITYPKEAYDAISSYTTLTIPIEGFYTGYNNTNEEFKNPYKSNVVNGNITIVFRETPDGNIYNFYVDFEDKKHVKDHPYGDEDTDYRYIMSKQDILNLYDNIEDENKISNKEYVVRWLAVRGDQGEVPSMIMSETKGEDSSYGDKWNTTIMENYITNTGIYFSDADKILENDGTISIYNDDTNELIHTFTKEEWNNYTRENPYKYVDPVKHIRAETSKTKQNSSLSIYNIKELDTKKILADFTKEELEDINLMYTYVTGVCNIEGQQQGVVKDIDYVYYVSEKSNGEISVETKKIPTQDVLNNKIYISAETNQYGDAKWKDGEFLVELPQEIIGMEINKVFIDNENVKLVAYDLYENDGKYFIKIITSNEEPESFKITVDCDMTPDPRSPSINKEIKLYSYNKYCNIYYHEGKDEYDVDSDNNTNEDVGTSITNLNLLSPTSLITLETITNYNKENEITIAPNIAAVEKEQRQAQINIGLTNNYPNVISGVQILGKIPFEGNKFILNDKNLGSNFTTTMTNDGITIPEELKEKAMVYYSEKENPDKDLLNANNGWTLKEDVKDFSKIKTYLIDVTQYTIDIGKNYSFNYTVNIPEGISYNSISYSNHAVFYELNTSGGKLQLSTEPNKVGLRIVRKYKLQINKSKQGFEQTKVSGATYTVDCSDAEGNVTTRILTTNSDGIVNMKNLFIGVTYTVKELKSPDNYLLNDEVLQFKVIEDETGKLQLETNSEKISLNNADELVIINTQDEPKYNVTITKRDSATKEPLTGVYFICNGKAYVTDKNGQITLEKLEKDTQYTLKEPNTEGYYALDNITFKFVRAENGNIEIESNNENFKNAQIQNNEEDLVKVNVTLENEKIPTYNLQILKVEENLKETDIEKLKPLKGAIFKLEGEDFNKEERLETDENGNITIPNLYQYVDGKAITGKYILQELQAPNGYSNNAEEIEFKVVKNAENNLEINITNKEQLITLKDVIVENGTIKLIIQDKPLFKLTKTDSKTGKPLANAQFVIYEIDSNKNDIDYAKDVNGNYVGTINNDGKYVITTDETGTIVLPLRGGFYRIEEIGYPEGYQENGNEDYFKIASKNEDIKNPEDQDNAEETVGDLEINTIEDLVRFSKSVNSGNSYKGKTVSLMRTLDFNEDSSYVNPTDTSFGDLNEDGVVEGIKNELTDRVDGIGFTPIGVFMGTFDGKNNEIRNIYMCGKSNVAFFLSLSNAKVKNFGITGNVIGIKASSFIAGIAAMVYDDTEISNCYNKAYISRGECNTKASWPGVAGIAAYLRGGNISNCYNSGNITGQLKNDYTGGIVGVVSGDSKIDKCYNLGTISNGANVGGIAGSLGFNRLGGTIGTGSGILDSSKVITNSYNTGNIYSNNDNSYVGGILGYFAPRDTGGYVNYYKKIYNCYNTGNVNGQKYVGRITGNDDIQCIDLQNCYYLADAQIKGEEINGLGISKSKNDMKSDEFVKLLGDTYWSKDNKNANNGYPIIQDKSEYIEEINYIEDLVKLSNDVNNLKSYSSKTIKLKKSLDFQDDNSYKNPHDTSYGDLNGNGEIEEIKNELTNKENGKGFTPIGTGFGKYFMGIFDGENNEIKNIYIKSDEHCVGIFGDVRNGKIMNLGVKGEIINKTNVEVWAVGGICGNIYNGTIKKCYFFGSVTGDGKKPYYEYSYGKGYSGGISGFVGNSDIINCYNSATIQGYRNVGGIVGSSYNMTLCGTYNIGDVIGNRYVGGIVGYENSDSSIINCYNSATIQGDECVGGIAGYTNWSTHYGVYNIGNIIGNKYVYTIGEAKYEDRCYYLENINISGTDIVKNGKSVSEDKMKQDEFVKQLGRFSWKKDILNKNEGYPVLEDSFGNYISEINCIEDLVELSEGVNELHSYENRTVVLQRSLDFEDNNSYMNPEDTSYGDINGDGKIEGIKNELTNKESGKGFSLIGFGTKNCFSGNFNGKGNEIKNLYVNSNGCAGLFGYINNAKISNLGIDGEIIGKKETGGIAGCIENSIIEKCYNKSEIHGGDDTGGIAGYSRDSYIKNCYNKGSIHGDDDNNLADIGGILGRGRSVVENCYNIGDVLGSSKHKKVGGITASESQTINNSYYLDNINITGNIIDSNSTASDEYMRTKEFYDKLNVDNVWFYKNNSYPKLNTEIARLEEVKNIDIQNTMKKFDITTEIKENLEGKRDGGTITGEYNDRFTKENNIKYVETINYNDNSKNEVIIIPDNDYLIYSITINDEKLNFTPDEEGNYKIPAEYFKEVKQNYHIVVMFQKKSKILTLNKVDRDNKNKKLEGAEFKISRVEERSEITNELKNIYTNSSLYPALVPAQNVVGNLTSCGTYYFTESNGKYISNNKNIDNSTANSYIPIDLSNKTGDFYLKVNAQVSSENNYDYGFATITQYTTPPPTYNDSTGQFIKISGQVSASDYEYTLKGGSIYYLHLGYRKDGSQSRYDDNFIVNSVIVYENGYTTYGFNNINGKYVSSNQSKNDTSCNSYIPIDLTERTGKYNLTLNAEISSERNCDYGYATIKTTETKPEQNDEDGKFIYISGEEKARDYTTILDGGKIYYLHLGYSKDSSISSGKDTFTINSIKLSLNEDDYYNGTQITDGNGEIKLALQPGKYQIIETKAPNEYIVDSTPHDVRLTDNNATITIENSKSVPYEINKIDKDTNEPIQGAKFAIYKLSEYYETIDFIKNNKNEYLGKQNEDGIYELETDANGKIKLELAPGLYKAVETKSAEGYALEESEALRTTYFRVEEENKEDEGNTNINNADLVINNIEDLVRFSNDVNSGNSYEGKTVVLARTLDFNEDGSYNNPEDTTFGDYNGDGTVEGIKQELAKEEGTGFKAVGNDTNPFKGTFNGNEHEIKNINIYANESSLYGGIIGEIVSGKIMNLGIVDAKIICNSKASGGIVGNATDSEIINCYNKGNLTTEARAPVEGIAGEITNSKIIRCYNEANITGNCTTGIVYYAKDSIIENCYNAGDLNSTAPIGGIAFNVSNSEIINCYNLATISNSSGPVGGIVGNTASNSKIINCYNLATISSSVPAGGIIGYMASNSEIINCYNNGEISGKYGSGGIVGNSLSNSKIINCYNTGKIIDADSLLGGIVGPNITNSTLNKCYYLNSSATQGVYNQKDIEGQVEAKTQEAMQSEEFVKQLNINKDNTNAQIPLSNWSYNEEGYPTLLPLEIKSGKQLTITNKKLQNNLSIKKVDKETNQKLSGAKFRLEANKDSLIGSMVSNSQYTFEKRGTQYISNNNGKSNSVANAYFPIDLRGYSGTFKLNVDYTISSESGGDIGYATITTSTNIPTYNENEYDIRKSYRFISCSGSSSNKASIDLIGGKKYYLHIGYRKNSSTNSGNDRFYINDISLKHNLDVETNEDGIIDMCLPSGEYKIKETSAPYGYNLSNEEKTVLISGIDDVQELTFENEKLQTKYNEPNVIITKKDKATGEIMPGVKFMVLDEQGNYIKDYTGTIVGEQEEIDGQDKYVVTTDENGQIKLKLNIGKYQLVEVKSLEGYALEDKKNFEITNEDEDYEVSGEGIIISISYPWKNYIIATSDGGMIETNSGINKTISARYTVDNKELDVTSDNGYVVKYNNSGKIENLIQISGLENFGAEIYEDTEGNFIVFGGGKQIEIPAEKTIDNEPIKLDYNGTNLRTIILKLNKDLKVIWVKNIDSFCVSLTSLNYIVENKEGNYIINFYGYSGNNIEIPAKDTVNGEKISSQRNANSVLIEYTKDGKVKNIYQNSYGIDSLIEKDSGGYIISSGSVIYELDSKMNEVRRYSNNISGISSGSSYATKDEGFIIGGNITSSNITISGENTASGNPISVTSDITPAIVLVKYDKNFKVEWAKAKSWSRSNECVNRIKQDNQGNYIVLSGLKLIKYNSNGDNITTVDLPSDMQQFGYLYTDRTNSKFVILDGNNNFRVYTLGTDNFTPITLEITNQKAGKVIVHHYLQGTGEEFGATPEKLSEDEVINGKVPEEYTTSPNMQIKDYTLIKDEKGDYIIPSNASGTYTEQDQHVYYYYNKTPLKLTVHHYLEGTQEKLAEDEQTFYAEGDHYKTNASEEVLKKYNLTNVIGDEEKDITQNEEVTYYYQIKTHQITTKVEIPEGRSEKGGTITGEGETPYETVDYEQSSKKDIIITPEKGYKVKQIKLISTSEDGQKTESTIYGNDETEESELTYTEGENNTITLTKFQNMIADKEIIVIFEPDEGRLIVHHYIEKSTEKIYDDQITVKPVGTKVETVPVKKDNYAVVKEPEDRNATITRETQEKIYYYQKQYNITTEVIKHNETYKDGTIVKNVKGGTITDEGKKSHEYVLKNRNSQNEIIITPNDGYEIVKITINNETLDYKNLLDEKGKVTIPKEFFKNVQEDKHIQVEFRKKTKVYVKYLEEGTEQPLYTEENKDYIELNGYEGQEYETVKKVIPNYKDSTLGITDENKLQVQPKGIMYADDVTVIYWYTRVSSGIIVRHIETNEKGEEIELENNVIDGLAGLNQLTNRNKYDKYIPVDRKQENSGNVNSHITIAKKEENSKTITFAQNKILEVWYFYEKQYDVTTSVKTHEEKVLNETTGKYETKQIAGGTISKEYEKDEQGNDKLDDKGNKIEITYEQILSRGDSKKQIELKPDENYRVKSVIKQKKIIKDGKEQYEEEQIFVEDKVQEDGSVILPEKLLVDVQNDYNIQVEFEKIPAKVIVQYKDAYTKESIHEDKILEGFVNDEYNEQRISIENYIPADPEPENNYGKMTKEPITVTYWYTKQFKITAEVKPHEEEELNNETGEIEKVQKEGGTIKIGENLPQELVTRGDNSVNTIIAIPDQNYRIKYVTINGKEIDLAKVLQENGTAKLPLFENMQEDKHIVVEFERIPTKLIVKHLDVETNNPITEDEQKDGFVGENYKTNPLNTKFYKLVDEKYPQNSEGKLTNEETIVTYYYEKLPFNLKIQKEVSNVLVNGEKLKVEENNIPMIIIAYKDIKDTTITIEYKIKVTNTGNIAGKAVIEEKIPEGFELATESNPNWKETEDTYTLQTDEILPGETKEYVVVLNWKQDTQNEGYKSNEAKIISTENEPKFDETTVLDNKDDAIVQIIINKTLQDVVDDIKDGNTKEVIKDIARSVKTGDAIIVSLITLAVFGTVLVIVLVKRKNER